MPETIKVKKGFYGQVNVMPKTGRALRFFKNQNMRLQKHPKFQELFKYYVDEDINKLEETLSRLRNGTASVGSSADSGRVKELEDRVAKLQQELAQAKTTSETEPATDAETTVKKPRKSTRKTEE